MFLRTQAGGSGVAVPHALLAVAERLRHPLSDPISTQGTPQALQRTQTGSLNFSHFVARQIWRWRDVSPRYRRAHRLQSRALLRCLPVSPDTPFDLLHTARN